MAKGHIRARGPGAWELKYDIGVNPATGRRITRFKTVHGAKRDAQRELRAILTALDGGTYADPSKMTVGRMAAANGWTRRSTRWREKRLNGIGRSSSGISSLHSARSRWASCSRSISRPTTRRRWRSGGGTALADCRRRPWFTTIACSTSPLKRARSLRLIASNPVEDVSRPRVKRHEIEVLEPAESAALLAAARTTRMFPIIFLALATGLRRGEVLGLRWSDVDLERRTLTVAQSLEQTRAASQFKAPKTKRSRRTIALSPSLVEELQAHRARQAADRLALGMGRDPAGLVFTRIDGDPIWPDSVTKMFGRIVARARIRPITFHGLRHTHATDLLRAGVHPKIASERLGHASIAITMDTYSHAMPGLQEDAAQRIDAALRATLPKG